MKLSASELELLKANSLSMRNARDIARHIESDYTVGGIFPNGKSGDFDTPNVERFQSKWCSWWPVARILLTLAKIFTGEKGDKAINALIALGDTVCV
ncbi:MULTISPECIES: hypothetical protein [unclassified Flavobacterium]|uniref:hypothetical protein n=1 Tax=unclassified Flavobacterium TaxID=196869 RepID=UPI00086BBE9E|nr:MULTISPECIES: hypothetical protein [unclassified Flavobacterium]MBN9283570.1 hypothetical protein [Flavobacterium sp.]ODS86500.1 MAG: hypothetical protein ABS44_13310 [Chryseobacterium sp. SCN 40-13]OJV69317.1 MAG: hypothetical protein BGO42_13155 [Flavobacterium sp. 40-81]